MNKLTTKDTEWVSKVLEKAFYTDPMLNFIYGKSINDPDKLKSFFRATYRYTSIFGECYSTPDGAGILMMLPPGQTNMTLGKMYKAGMLAPFLRMGWAPISRSLALMDFIEKEHKSAAPSDHYYIMTMGVLPERQGTGLGKKLMAKALEIADANNKPCYLETQNKNNVPFYQSFGFEVVTDKEIPKGGLNNWGMLRQSRNENSKIK